MIFLYTVLSSIITNCYLFPCQDREVLNEMTSSGTDLSIFFVVSKLEPEDRTESSDEDDEPRGHAAPVKARKKRELEVQNRKKTRVYERLVKNGHFLLDCPWIKTSDSMGCQLGASSSTTLWRREIPKLLPKSLQITLKPLRDFKTAWKSSLKNLYVQG